MSKCEFVYETEPGPFFDYAPRQAILRCRTHNCTIIDATAMLPEGMEVCLFDRIEALEERVAKLERGEHETNIDVGDLLGRGR
jgi:hypothetical protein